MDKKFIKLGKEQVIGIKKVDKKNAKIVSVCEGRIDESNNGYKFKAFDGKDFLGDFSLKPCKSHIYRTIGYIQVEDENTYVKIVKPIDIVFILLLLAICISLTVRFCGSDSPIGVKPDIEDGEDYDGEDNIGNVGDSSPDVVFDFNPELFVTSEDNELVLGNSAENEGLAYVKYSVIHEGKVLLETDWIKPSKCVTWCPYDYLEKGDYDIVYNAQMLSYEDYNKLVEGKIDKDSTSAVATNFEISLHIK